MRLSQSVITRRAKRRAFRHSTRRAVMFVDGASAGGAAFADRSGARRRRLTCGGSHGEEDRGERPDCVATSPAYGGGPQAGPGLDAERESEGPATAHAAPARALRIVLLYPLRGLAISPRTERPSEARLASRVQALTRHRTDHSASLSSPSSVFRSRARSSTSKPTHGTPPDQPSARSSMTPRRRAVSRGSRVICTATSAVRAVGCSPCSGRYTWLRNASRSPHGCSDTWSMT